MKQIDGGNGGGQLLRLAVGLAALDGTPIRIENVRGARPEPGLRAQHVAAIEAVGSLVEASCDGVEVGSGTVRFDPGPVTGGEVSVDVGTAGSIALVFDAVLPLALETAEPITVHATGGTDVKWSPPIDAHRYVKFPLLERAGLSARVDLTRRGFYPQGGGSATLQLSPAAVGPITVRERGDLESVTVHSIATDDLADADVAARQATAVTDTLQGQIGAPIATQTASVPARSTGSSVLVVARYEQSIAGFDRLGERGRPAEAVGESAAQAFLSFQDTTAAVESHLADQLVPILALRGGQITTPSMTDHLESSVALLSAFGHELSVTDADGVVRISAEP